MATYFTADWHIQHEGVLTMCNRPFASIDEHDDYLAAGVNRTIKNPKTDRLFVLGDAGWRGIEGFLSRVECKNIHLIWGNHDRAGFAKFVKSAEDVAEIKLGDVKVFLSHYPHAFWPSSHYGSLHLYGHMHGEREDYLDTLWPDRRSMDVGVDVAKRLLGDYIPFHEDFILSRLLARPGHDPVEWYREREKQRNAD